MKKNHTVKNNIEFNNIIKSGICLKNKYFVLYYQNNDLNKYRFGISVPKKVCNAVNRNKLKRQIRNILHNHQNIYSNTKDYIIIIRKSCLMENFHILEDNLINLIKKVN